MKAIINGRIILKDRIVEGMALLFDDKIRGLTDKLPEGTEVIDANGAYVAPGLIDLHIHGYLGKDVCDGEEESIRTICEGLVKNGVTGFLPTTMTVDMEVIQKAIDVCRSLKEESKSWNGTTILGVHAEGPFINPKKKGAQNEKYILKPDAEFVKKNADMIRIISLAPEMDEDFEAIKDIAYNTDVVMSMGHTDADYDTAVKSVAAGVKHATHLFNAMSALGHRSPGVVGAALSTPVTTELIVDKYHVNPALYDVVWKLKGDKLCFITDCLPAGGLPAGEYTLGGSRIISRDNLCKLPDGTIAGSILKLNKGVMNVYENSSMTLPDAVRCATLNPANAIGIGDKKGSLDVGKDADIIIADEKFDIIKTIIGGTVRYEA